MNKEECSIHIRRMQDALKDVETALGKPVKKYRTKQYLIRSKYLLGEQIEALTQLLKTL